ncbi:hypothetical protein Bca4012_078302 [Brassica carinata]
MVIVTHISTSSHQILPSFFHLRLRIPATSPASSRLIKHGDGGGGIALLTIRAYIEKPNSISSFANTVVGSLPVIGLLARILSDESGVGRDLVDFAEYRKRVGNNCAPSDSRAFYCFNSEEARYCMVELLCYMKLLPFLLGVNVCDQLFKWLVVLYDYAGEPLYVLLCCWVAAVGAGLLKSEEILEGVTRVSISNDLEFEEQNFIALMTEARQEVRRIKKEHPEDHGAIENDRVKGYLKHETSELDHDLV